MFLVICFDRAWQFDSFIDENSASSIDRRFHAVSTDKAITLSYRANPTPTYITNNFTIGTTSC